MQRLLRRACHAVNLARAQDLPLRPEMIALIERCYDAVVADGLAYHTAQPALTKARPRGPPPRRIGHNLLLRLSTRKADVLRFLTDPSVPFTNNLAERDGRMMKLRQKISGGFRSEQGRGLRRYPIADLDRQKAGLGSAPDTHSRTGVSHRHSPLGLTTPPTWLLTKD